MHRLANKPFFMKIFRLGFALLSVSIFTQCLNPPDFPDEPVIEFLSLSADSMVQTTIDANAFVIAKFKFTDGDGDLGNSDAKSDIFVVDKRTNEIDPTARELPEIPSQGAQNGISGEMSVKLLSSCCLPPENLGEPCSQAIRLDTIVYEVYIKDRAGHESNRVATPPIILKCRR